jgi:hypothetical protein
MMREDEKQLAAMVAKTLAMMCVRNTYLEDLHAGISPVSKTGDYSDVVVIDGTGRKIPWTELSRLNDLEMKTLMKEVVNRLYTFQVKSGDRRYIAQMEKWGAVAAAWDEPELVKPFSDDP